MSHYKEVVRWIGVVALTGHRERSSEENIVWENKHDYDGNSSQREYQHVKK